jgi:DNA-binding transcriptional MerR regulator
MTGQFVSAAIPGQKDLRFSAEEVTELAGVTYRQLDHWIRNNHLTADHLKDLGSGHPRSFSLSDLVEVAVMQALTDVGFRVGVAARLASAERRPHWETP